MIWRELHSTSFSARHVVTHVTILPSSPPPLPTRKRELVITGIFPARNFFITVLNKFQKIAAGENYRHYSFILIQKQKGCNCNDFVEHGNPSRKTRLSQQKFPVPGLEHVLLKVFGMTLEEQHPGKEDTGAQHGTTTSTQRVAHFTCNARKRKPENSRGHHPRQHSAFSAEAHGVTAVRSCCITLSPLTAIGVTAGRSDFAAAVQNRTGNTVR